MSLTTLNAFQQGGPVLDKLKQLWEGIRSKADDPNLGYIGASMLPGVGEATDLVEIGAGLQDRSPGRVGLGIAGLMLPFVGAAGLKKVGPKLKSGFFRLSSEIEDQKELRKMWEDANLDYDAAVARGVEDLEINSPEWKAQQARTSASYERYDKLTRELDAIEEASPEHLYVTDRFMDHDDAMNPYMNDLRLKEGTEEYWDYLYDNAIARAASSLDDVGLDINKLLGRNVY